MLVTFEVATILCSNFVEFSSFLMSNILICLGSNQGISADQRATYLPVMRALLNVMETNRPSPQDINTLMIATRDLNKKVPKGNGLGGFGNFGNFGGFGIDDLESMGLPESGDMVANVDGVPHIRTSFGKKIVPSYSHELSITDKNN